MLFDLLLLPFVGPVKGLVAVARQVQEMVDKELNSPVEIKKRLNDLQFDLEMGRISEEEYQKGESELLERLEQIESGQD